MFASEVVIVKKRRLRLPHRLQQLAADAGMQPRDFLARKAKRAATQAELGRNLGVSRETAIRWLRKCNIKWLVE